MAELIAYILAMLFYTFLGAFFIRIAIADFMEKRYFWFGVDVMLVCHQIACMFDVIFKN